MSMVGYNQYFQNKNIMLILLDANVTPWTPSTHFPESQESAQSERAHPRLRPTVAYKEVLTESIRDQEGWGVVRRLLGREGPGLNQEHRVRPASLG